MNITALDFNHFIGIMVFAILVSFISIPILHVLRIFAYDTTFKKLRKEWRKRRLEKQASGEKNPPFFILERKKIRAPKRYVIYYYGYLVVIVVVIFSVWLRAHHVFLYVTQWVWVLKLLLDVVIGVAYLRRTRYLK